MKRNQLPVIRLTPWEHAPDAVATEIEAPAQNVAPFEWRGQSFQVAARFAAVGDGSRHVFVRFLGDEDEANWVLGSKGSCPERCSHLKLSGRLRGLEKKRLWPFGRLFFFAADELKTPQPFSVFVTTGGSGCWIPSNGLLPYLVGGDSVSFRLTSGRGESLRHIPARDIRARLLEAVQDPNSDARFALDWRCLTEEERRKTLFKLDRGSIDEMRHLLWCALRAERIVGQQSGEWCWYVANDSPRLDYWSDEQGAFPGWVYMPLRLRVWNRLAYEYFAPSTDYRLLHNHWCVRHWFRHLPSFLVVTTQSPTQHERLEAALWLRDWAQGKVPPRKLQLLLSRV